MAKETYQITNLDHIDVDMLMNDLEEAVANGDYAPGQDSAPKVYDITPKYGGRL